MPKVIHTRPLYGKLDNMHWEPLEATEEHEHRYLSPELTDEQAAHYLLLNGFHAQTATPQAPEELPPVIPQETLPPLNLPEGENLNTGADGEGSDSKITEGAGENTPPAKSQKPARETPAQRKARLAAESKAGK